MADSEASLETLEAEITSIKDTHANLVGLVEKMASTQLALDEAGFKDFAAGVGEAFGGLSAAAQQLETTAHDAEIERNRIVNES